MDEKMKDNKLNESEIGEVSGGCKPLGELVKPIRLVDFKHFKPGFSGYHLNWLPKKKPEQNPTDPVKPKDITKQEEPKKPTDINISPNPESKN